MSEKQPVSSSEFDSITALAHQYDVAAEFAEPYLRTLLNRVVQRHEAITPPQDTE